MCRKPKTAANEPANVNKTPANGIEARRRYTQIEIEALCADTSVFEKKTKSIDETGKTCSECLFWKRDTVGDGTGAGHCYKNMHPATMKWPRTIACHKFKGRGE